MEHPRPACPAQPLRPYRLLCAVCRLGGGSPPGGEAADRLLASVLESPDRPVTLRCNAGDTFAFQDPGPADDSPGGADLNRHRDLEILHQLDLLPGSTVPVRMALHRVLDRIEDVAALCADPAAGSAAPGCPLAATGCYRRGRAGGIQAIVSPRSQAAMDRDKRDSLEAMRQAAAIRVRPHILLCAVCQYGNGTRPPYPPDNLPEMMELILQEPDRLIELAPGADWMMCAPCPDRSPGLNACVTHQGAGGLPNQLRDLRVLRKLGLGFGATLKAGELFRLIFDRFSGTLEVCRFAQAYPSAWWDPCAAASADSPDYEKGKQMLMARFARPPAETPPRSPS